MMTIQMGVLNKPVPSGARYYLAEVGKTRETDGKVVFNTGVAMAKRGATCAH